MLTQSRVMVEKPIIKAHLCVLFQFLQKLHYYKSTGNFQLHFCQKTKEEKISKNHYNTYIFLRRVYFFLIKDVMYVMIGMLARAV